MREVLDRPRVRGAIQGLAGPLLIAAAVVVVLHDIILGGRIGNQNPDVLTVFLPNHCFLGRSLAAGTIPGWNPFTMGGAPFLADPQSGWMYAPAMLLYALFSCDVALRIFIVAQPLLAGLGIYWFLRSEKLSHPAATTGGVVLALAVSGSVMVMSIPFSDSLAWTALMLAAASRSVHARNRPARLLWVAATALAWGQLASAHLSHGLVMGTAALAAYLVVALGRELRGGRLSGREVAAFGALLVVLLPALNLAHLLPVAGYVARSSLGLGYDGMRELAAELRGAPVPPLEIFRATEPIWPLKLATSPGGYLGAAALVLAFAPFWSKRLRPLALAFGVYAAAFYIAALRPVVEAVAPLIRSVPFADFYAHSPGRFFYAVVFALAILAGIGVEAWRDADSTRRRALMLVPGLLLWGVGPIAAGAFPSRLALFVVGAIAGVAVLVAAVRRPVVLVVLPLVLAVELSADALAGQAGPVRFGPDGLETETLRWMPLGPLPEPQIGAAAFIRGGPAVDAGDASEGRLLSLAAGLTPSFRPVLAEVEVAEGYNPVQVRRYWTYVRKVDQSQLRYNMSIFGHLPADGTLDLLDVSTLVAPDPASARADGVVDSASLDRGWTEVDSGEGQTIYRLNDPAPRASLVGSWKVVDGPTEALEAVTSNGFDVDAAVVVEEDPGLGVNGSSPEAGTATYRQSAQAAEITVDADAPAILLVRNVFDPHWRATVNGNPAELLVADYFLQGIPVPAGRHTVRLEYDDPSIGYGLAGSGITLLLVLVATAVLQIRERGRRRARAER